MRISRFVTSNNWRYAAGEVVLIVIGVSIALAASSWYENWQERRIEIRALGQLKVALEADLRFLSEQQENLQEFERFLSELLKHMQGQSPYSEQVGPYFSGLTNWRMVRIRSAPYEEIKNHGFSLISNPELRTRLIDLYEILFPALLRTSIVDSEFTRDKILPYFYSRFRRQSEERSWKPIAYDELRSDLVFENIVLAKQSRLRNLLLPRFEEISEAIQEILADIESELGAGVQ